MFLNYKKILFKFFILCSCSVLAQSDPALTDSLDLTKATKIDSNTFIAKEKLGFNLGVALSAGVVSGETFTNVPTGGTVVIGTPLGFKVGPFDYTVSLGLGSYSGNFEPADSNEPTVNFDPTFIGLGGNLTIAEFIFSEGHIGIVGEGTGFRGFAGVTLERLMKNELNLPFNLLVGSEAFYSSDMAGAGVQSGWLSVGLRLDYSL